MRKPGLFTTRRVREGPATKSLAYASGYQKQSAIELLVTISVAAVLYNENAKAHELRSKSRHSENRKFLSRPEARLFSKLRDDGST